MGTGSLSELIKASLKVGVTGFGGGSALIPVIEREYVQQRKIIDGSTYTAHVIVANITPGGLPVKLAALAGSRIGAAGAVLASVAMGFPGVLATVVLLALFSAIGSGAIRLVEFAAVGITVFIAVLLIEYIHRVLRSQKLLLAVAIMLVAYVLTGLNQTAKMFGLLFGKEISTSLPQLNAVALVLLAVAVAAVVAIVRRGKRVVTAVEPIQSGRAISSAVVFLVATILILGVAFVLGGGYMMSLIGFSTVTSFGGGEAYVGVVDGFFLSSGLVDSMSFYGQALPIANALPGSILNKLAAAIGYSYGMEHFGVIYAAVFATLGFLISVTGCCAIVMFLMAAYDRAANSAFVRYLGVVILPVICGLLLSTLMSMLNASMTIAKNAEISVPAVGWISIAGIVLAWFMHKRLPDLALLGITGSVSLVAMLIAS
ncbi:MAG: chromate transporter [Varibaculum sp.]|nr:chromate transporter [Varibaculum sp.]